MYGDRKFIVDEISRIKNEMIGNPGYYDSFNLIDSKWNDYKEVIDDMGELETIDIRNPLYFKSTNKQYVFDVKNSEKLKKMLLRKLDEMLDGADSLIDAINDLSVKTADEDDKEAILRRIKLTELIIKMGKRTKQTQ